jgi:hypothetical protein
VENFYQLSKSRKKEIFNQAGNQTGLPESAIEKDWWVTLVLRSIFELPYARHIVFKGGTSLSKGWNLIDRFSEDIDLALDRGFLGPFDGDISKTQVVKLRKASFSFISADFRKELHGKIAGKGITDIDLFANESISHDTDPLVLELRYLSVTDELKYIQPRVLVEVGARSLKEPYEEKPIQSIVGKVFDTPHPIPVVLPKRTFLEKVFLLHEEFLKAEGSVKLERMSRHLYDLFILMDTEHGIGALQDEKLYRVILEHRKKFNAIRGIDYSHHNPAMIDFIPPDHLLETWKRDYQAMRESMIYGEAPEFDQLILKLKLLRDRFRQILMGGGRI